VIWDFPQSIEQSMLPALLSFYFLVLDLEKVSKEKGYLMK